MHWSKSFELRLHAYVEGVVGPLEMWELQRDWYRFRAERELTLSAITKLADTLGTDAINFNFGEAGWGGSDVTPGDPTELGYVEVKLSEADVARLRMILKDE